MRMSETTRTHTAGKQLDCDIPISSLMKHILTNRPTFHSDSEKLRSKILATKKQKRSLIWSVIWYSFVPCSFGVHVIGSTPLLLLHCLIEKTGDSTHRRTCRWGWGGWNTPLPPPFQILRDSDFWGSKRNLGKPNFHKSFHVSFR